MHRLFLASPVPPEVAEALSSWAVNVLSAGSVRFVQPENLHVTLIFYGSVSTEDAVEIAKLTQEVRWDPVPVVPTSLALLSKAALAIDLRASQVALDDLNNRLIQLVALRPEKEELRGLHMSRRLRLHVTVARSRVASLKVPTPVPPQIPFSLGELYLYESHLSPTGATYQVIASAEKGLP